MERLNTAAQTTHSIPVTKYSSTLRKSFKFCLCVSAQKPSSESSSSSRIVCLSKPSSLRFPTSFSSHSAYLFSIAGSALNLASPLDDELCHASSSFFFSRAACTEATDRPVSSGKGTKLKRDMRTVEDRWRIEPVMSPITAATPR